MLKTWIRHWGPAALMMTVIFVFSSCPSADLPNFGGWDYFVKKGGHALGYALLALTYWHGFGFVRSKKWSAWILAICYAITDEFHQTFVPGRHPSPWDVLIFDNFGALLGVILWEWLATRRKRN